MGPDNLLSSFDPLCDSAPALEAPATAAKGIGLPTEVMEAFKAADKVATTAAEAGTKEFLPSGLSLDGQNKLMKQIEESAKKMSAGKEEFSAFDALAKLGA